MPEIVLVVSDSRLKRKMLSTILREYLVVAVDDGEAAVGKLEAYEVALVLVEDEGVGATGSEICEFAKSIRPDVRVILLTSKDIDAPGPSAAGYDGVVQMRSRSLTSVLRGEVERVLSTHTD